MSLVSAPHAYVTSTIHTPTCRPRAQPTPVPHRPRSRRSKRRAWPLTLRQRPSSILRTRKLPSHLQSNRAVITRPRNACRPIQRGARFRCHSSIILPASYSHPLPPTMLRARRWVQTPSPKWRRASCRGTCRTSFRCSSTDRSQSWTCRSGPCSAATTAP